LLFNEPDPADYRLLLFNEPDPADFNEPAPADFCNEPDPADFCFSTNLTPQISDPADFEQLLNDRPRKCLGFKTPNEVCNKLGGALPIRI